MTRLTGAITAFLLASSAPLMQGALQISYDETSPTPFGPAICGVGPDTGPVVCTALPPGATISVLSATSNSPGTPALAEQEGSTLFISTTRAVTLHIWFAAQDFTAPSTPPPDIYTSNLSITSTTGTGTVSLESCVDGSNGLAPPTTAFCAAPEDTLTNAALAYSGSSSNSSHVSNIATSIIPIYSLSQELTLNLSAGTGLNIITSQTLTPVPEPASLALLGGGLLGIGLAFRKKLSSKK